MNELLELILVFAVLYILECTQVVPRSAVAVQTLVRGRFSAHRSLPIGLWRDAAVVVGMPLPPLGLIFVVDEWPVVFGEDGLVGEDGVARPWAAAIGASAERSKVVIGEATVASMATEISAEGLARALRTIAAGAPDQRERLVEEVLAARLDGDGALRRFATFRRAVLPLRIAENLLFVAFFAGGPIILLTSLSNFWLEAVGFAFAAWVATFVGFLLARRELFPDDNGPPTGRWALMAIWPLSAMRASDMLGRYLLPDAAPLAAATLLGRDGFRVAARRALAELRHGGDGADPWFHARRRRAVERFLGARGLDGDVLFLPPVPDDAGVRAFCPRCRAQFVAEREICSACDGIRLLPITAAPAAVEAPPPPPSPAKKPKARRRRR